MTHIFLDCKGLCCPMPIVEIARRFKELKVGDRLEVEADDPAFKPDVEAWVECTGHKLLSLSESDAITKAVIEKMI